MAGNYTINGADLDRFYMPTTTMIDRYVKTGSLWSWGYNVNGGLGINDTTDRSSPVQTVSGGTNWSQVAGTQRHGAGIKTDGTLWLWGKNILGEVGDSSGVNKSSPVQTGVGGTTWKQVSVANNNSTGHSAAIKTDGTLWTWGSRFYGHLGDNSSSGVAFSPIQTLIGGNDWRKVSTGYGVTGAIKTDGTLYMWGYNSSGQLGTNDRTWRSLPTQTVSGGTNWAEISTGGYSTAAIKTDGTLWTWGGNSYGVLGNSQINNSYSSPVQTIAGGTNWKQVSLNSDGTCVAIKTDGTLWTWGKNYQGQIGDNTSGTHRSSPVQTIASGTNWRQASFGQYNNIVAIKNDGTLWTWGSNTNGQLGDNTAINKSSPVQTVASGTNWKQVSGGLAIHFYDAYNLYPK